MEPNLLSRLATFIKESYTRRIKEVASGLIMGGIGGYNIFFPKLPPELIHTWIGVWLWMKTVFFAFSSSIATAYGAYLIEKHKNKKNERPKKRQKNNGKAA